MTFKTALLIIGFMLIAGLTAPSLTYANPSGEPVNLDEPDLARDNARLKGLTAFTAEPIIPEIKCNGCPEKADGKLEAKTLDPVRPTGPAVRPGSTPEPTDK